nr:acyltransferase [Acetobacter oeni]
MNRKTSVVMSIQYMRAIAALSVVVFHQFQTIIPLTQCGKYGVDLFFIISGFIMIALTDRKETSPSDFVLERFVRIVPLYYIATLATLVLVKFHIYVPHLVTSNIEHVLKSVCFMPDFDKEHKLFPVLYLGWTLNYEMFFYFIFAGCLLLNTTKRIVVLIFFLIFFCTLGAANDFSSAIAKAYTDPRLLEFGAGAVLGRVFGINLDNFSKEIQFLYSLSVTLFLAVMSLAFSSLLAAVIISIIFTAALMVERGGTLPQSRVLLYLGSASYSIYLFQSIASDAVKRVVLYLNYFISVSATVQSLLSVAGGVILGCCVFQFIEQPVTRFLRKKLKERASAKDSRRAAAYSGQYTIPADGNLESAR